MVANDISTHHDWSICLSTALQRWIAKSLQSWTCRQWSTGL